jgi:hypothetical protein
MNFFSRINNELTSNLKNYINLPEIRFSVPFFNSLIFFKKDTLVLSKSIGESRNPYGKTQMNL